MKVLIFLLSVLAPSYQEAFLTFQNGIDTTNFKACDRSLSCQAVQVSDIVLAGESFDLPLPNCKAMKKKNDIDARSAAFENEEGCEFIVSSRMRRYRGRVGGSNGSSYSLEPCSEYDGCHVWKARTQSKKHGSAPLVKQVQADREVLTGLELPGMAALRQLAVEDRTTIITYTIALYYTIDLARMIKDIPLLMDELVARTNQIYINNNLPVRVEIFCIQAANIRDNNKGMELFNNFQAMGENAAALRGSADAAAIVATRLGGNCELYNSNAVSSGNTFAAVDFGCGESLAISLAYMFGCFYDREEAIVNEVTAPYEYGYATHIGKIGGDQYGYRTLLSTRPNNGDRQIRIDYFSGPDIYYKGVPTGNATENNARVIRDNRMAFAAIGDESGTCIPRKNTFCWARSAIYRGKIIEKAKKAKNARKCKERCEANVECKAWTWFARRYPKRKLKRKCYLRSTVSEVVYKKRVTSGHELLC